MLYVTASGTTTQFLFIFFQNPLCGSPSEGQTGWNRGSDWGKTVRLIEKTALRKPRASSTAVTLDPAWHPESVNTQMEKELRCLAAHSVQQPRRAITHVCFCKLLAFPSLPSSGCPLHHAWQASFWRGLKKFPSGRSLWLIISSSGKSSWWGNWKELMGGEGGGFQSSFVWEI